MIKKYSIVLVIVGLVIYFTLSEMYLSKNVTGKENFSLPTSSSSVLETKTNEEGVVKVSVTPKIASEIMFEIVFDTHTTELTDDPIEAVILKGGDGKEYRPIRWDGDPPGGHHRSGTLNFGPIVPGLDAFELTIKNIGGIIERKFLWVI